MWAVPAATLHEVMHLHHMQHFSCWPWPPVKPVPDAREREGAGPGREAPTSDATTV